MKDAIREAFLGKENINDIGSFGYKESIPPEELKFASKIEAVQYLASLVGQKVIIGDLETSDYFLDEKKLDKYPDIKIFGSELLNGNSPSALMIDIEFGKTEEDSKIDRLSFYDATVHMNPNDKGYQLTHPEVLALEKLAKNNGLFENILNQLNS